MENGNGLVKTDLVNSNYCSAYEKYILHIKVKVLERNQGWEGKEI